MAVYDLFETAFKNEKVEVATTNGLSPHIESRIVSSPNFQQRGDHLKIIDAGCRKVLRN